MDHHWAASTANAPAYELLPAKDELKRQPTFQSDFPDPKHPIHKALLAGINLGVDSASMYAFSPGGILINPSSLSSSEIDLKAWSLARGFFVIISTTERRVTQIKVELVTRQWIPFPQDNGKKEADVVSVRTVVLGDKASGGVWLQKGINTFEYLLNVPPDATVSDWMPQDPAAEWMPDSDPHHRMIYNVVVGTAVGSAKGLFGKDLTAEKEIVVCDTPRDQSELALDLHVEGFQDDLGPCTLDVSSTRFILASALSLSLTLPSPPPTLKIYALRCYLDQTITFTSFRNQYKKHTLRQKVPVLHRGFEGPLNARGLQALRADPEREKGVVLFDASMVGLGREEGWSFEEVARVPNARHLSCSTHPSTITSVRASSELVVEIYFTTDSPSPSSSSPSSSSGARMLSSTLTRRPVTVGSCCLLPERTDLPDYSGPGPQRMDHLRQPVLPHEAIPCQCDETNDERLLQIERDHLLVRKLAAADAREAVKETGVGKKVGEIRTS